MAYFNKYVTSLYGRRVGIQRFTTAISGGSAPFEVMVGPEAIRMGTVTETTSTNLAPYGVSKIAGSSAASSSVFTIDPPVPGIEKTLWFSSTGNINCYVKTRNSETFQSSLGSSFTTLQCTAGGLFRLVGLTTAIYGILNGTSGTSSQGGSLLQTTST